MRRCCMHAMLRASVSRSGDMRCLTGYGRVRAASLRASGRLCVFEFTSAAFECTAAAAVSTCLAMQTLHAKSFLIFSRAWAAYVSYSPFMHPCLSWVQGFDGACSACALSYS